MASVFIDIPGIGNVEAKNAATEATLQELLTVMAGVQANTKGSGGGTTPPGGGAGPKNAFGAAGAALQRFQKSVLPVIGLMGGLASGITETISKFANVGDSVERAADVFSVIPVVGAMFTAVASASEKVNNSFLSAAKSGATFGGSINSFAASASAAGMPMDKFGQLVARNADAMIALGGETDGGAKRFAQLSKSIRSTSGDLYALGYSTEDVNQGIANYTRFLKVQGMSQGKSNAELVAGAKNYLKEIDMLAKVTGQSREQAEAEMQRNAKDAQLNFALAGKDKEVRESVMSTVSGLKGPLGSFAKDLISSGTATTKENQELMAQLPESAAMLQEYHAKMARGEAITLAERNELNNLMLREGAASMKNIGAAGAASAELKGVGEALVATQELQVDGVKKAVDANKNAVKNTDGMNAQMQRAQQALSAISNEFQMVLANSGILDAMISAFKFVAGIVQTLVVPAFNILSFIISTVSGIFTNGLYPILVHVSDYIGNSLLPVFQGIGDLINTYVAPGFQYISELISTYVTPAFQAIGDFIDQNLSTILDGMGIAVAGLTALYLVQHGAELVRTGLTVAGNLAMGVWNLAIMAGGAAMALLTSPVFLVIAGVTALWFAFKKLGGDFDIVRDGLKFMWSMFKTFLLNLKLGFLKVLDYLPGVDMKDAITETEADIAEQTVEREKLVDNIKTRAAENRAKLDEKQTAEQKARHERTSKKLGAAEEKETAAREKAAKAAERNLNGSETNLLLSEAKAQGSGFIKQGEATKAAEATKKEIESKAEAKTAEAAKKSEEAKETPNSKPAATTQESAESLLASLNTKLDQLIKINKGTYDINERQLTVQQSQSNDLYVAA